MRRSAPSAASPGNLAACTSCGPRKSVPRTRCVARGARWGARQGRSVFATVTAARCCTLHPGATCSSPQSTISPHVATAGNTLSPRSPTCCNRKTKVQASVTGYTALQRNRRAGNARQTPALVPHVHSCHIFFIATQLDMSQHGPTRCNMSRHGGTNSIVLRHRGPCSVATNGP